MKNVVVYSRGSVEIRPNQAVGPRNLANHASCRLDSGLTR